MLVVAALLACASQSITLYYVSTAPDKTDRPYLRFVNAAVLPYFSTLLPACITFWQHQGVFAKDAEEDKEDDSVRHESMLSMRGTVQDMLEEDDEPDLTAEFDITTAPKDKNQYARDLIEERPSNMLVKRLIQKDESAQYNLNGVLSFNNLPKKSSSPKFVHSDALDL